MPRVAPLLLALSLPLAACSSETDTSDGVDSGLSHSKQGKQLDPGEQTQLCESAIRYYDARTGPDPKAAQCRNNAVTTALASADIDLCEQTYQNCLAEPEDEDPEPCSFGPATWTGCTATIAEIEACYTEWSDGVADLVLSLSCDKLPEYAKHWPGDDQKNGPACTAALAICPDLVPDYREDNDDA